MANLEKARAEIRRAERILRSRYHYEHPIFTHLGDALAALEEPAPVEPKAPPSATEEEPGAAAETESQESAPVETATSTNRPVERPRKRGKA